MGKQLLSMLSVTRKWKPKPNGLKLKKKKLVILVRMEIAGRAGSRLSETVRL